MQINIPDNAEHPVLWTMDYIQRKTGAILSEQEKNELVVAWHQYVQNSFKATKTANSDLGFEDPPIEGGPSPGFTTGDQQMLFD